MAKFLNTSATSYYLEELIKSARLRLVLISPYLKLNDRVRELLRDTQYGGFSVQILYGKKELPPGELAWLKDHPHIQTRFCKNLHAKCYLNEEACIITSLNLYDFSQVNNNEMGILLKRKSEPELYQQVIDEADRLLRISSDPPSQKPATVAGPVSLPKRPQVVEVSDGKLTTSKLAKKLEITTEQATQSLVVHGLLEWRGDRLFVTDKAKTMGAEFRVSKKFGGFFLWPDDLVL
jgi:phosphatidylserine/phosphatidylglycerophosphate/cardiolipin synthase-like enzyme